MRASSRRSPFNLLSKLVLGIGILVAIGLPSSIVDAKGGSIIIPNSSLQRTVVSSTTTTTTPTTKKHQHGGLVDLKKNQKVIDLSTSSATASALDQRGGGNTDRKDAITGAIILTLIERVVNKILTSNGIKFPSMLGGCIALFFVMILADLVRPGLGGSIYSTLNPGSVFLAKWLPVFFVPGLAMLPLAPSVGSGLEIVKALSVVGLGFLYTSTTVAYTVLFLRRAGGANVKITPIKKMKVAKSKKKSSSGTASKPYAESTLNFFARATLLSGLISILATKMGNDYATPLRAAFLFFSTFTTYVWGARLPPSITKIVHPLIISTVVTSLIMDVTGIFTGESFKSVLRTYKVGSLDWMKAGAGDYLLFLLGPTVISFAVSMYSRRVLLKQNLAVVASAMLVSSAGGLFGTAAFVRLIRLGGNALSAITVRRSMVPRMVTTALAMEISSILGGDIAITSSAVVLTSISGAQYGKRVMDSLGVTDPIARGLAVGSAGQGLGAASLLNEPDAFPFAAMGLILTAVTSTLLVAIPAVKDALIKVCGGL